MAEAPVDNPVPTKPPLHLKGGYLVVALPEDLTTALFCVPAVRALRHGRPNSTLAVVVPEFQRAVWEHVDGIDHVVCFPPKASVGAVVRLIKETGVDYESSFAWESGVAAAAFAKLKIKQRLGTANSGLSSKLTEVVEIEKAIAPPVHRLRSFLLPLAKLGFETLVPRNFPVPELPPRPSPPVVGLAPGSDRGQSYRWPVEKFKELAVLLHERHGVDLVVVNLPGDLLEARQLADALSERYGDLLQDCVGRFDLRSLMEAFPYLSTLVCSDGSMAHLAALTGLPVVPVFGPGDEVGTRPMGKSHQIVTAHVECMGCGQAKCPLDHRCMLEVTPEMVASAVETVLGLPQAESA